jgi:tRNA 5-methylaminomethyl-2-thiouridine biosynthesis bifunctional protein
VAELGFGTGLNVLALLQLWRETRPTDARLHIFSVEAHPLAPADAARALQAFPEVADLGGPLLARWPGGARGFERREWPELGAALDVATLEAAEALGAWSGQADAWFLDGFAPSRNPEIWRPEVLDLVRARSAPDARLATFTVAGAVRRGLTERRWSLTRAPGHGNKLERLEGRLSGDPSPAVTEAPRVKVIGAGIAGASLARAFSRLGASCTVVDPEPGGGASGNRAALASARIDAGDGPAARLYAQAFARAADLYLGEAPQAVIARGALRLSRGAKDDARFHALAGSDLFRPDALAALDRGAASARLGAEAEEALWMSDALTLDPARVLEAWLSAPSGFARTTVALTTSSASRRASAPEHGSRPMRWSRCGPGQLDGACHAPGRRGQLGRVRRPARRGRGAVRGHARAGLHHPRSPRDG